MATEDSTGAQYSQWKGWGGDHAFGSFTPGDADYFAREVRNATAGHTVTDVLEVGFGDGTFLGYGKSRGWTMTGTELSQFQVSLGTAAGYDVYTPDYVDSLAEASLDLIVAFDVLEHIPQDNVIDFLSNLASKLRPEGRMLLRYPNSDTWLGNPLQHGDPTHVTEIGYYKMTYFAESSGLRILNYRAPVRRGFKSSFVHGLHRITAGPIIALSAGLKKALYFPGMPIVLSSFNAVCTLGRAPVA